jgi:GcrA cell cycle regulator
MRFDWTAAKIDQLRALWGKGLSTVQIGACMGTSKNAITNKAHRIGLKRPSPIKQLAAGQKPKRQRSRSARNAVALEVFCVPSPELPSPAALAAPAASEPPFGRSFCQWPHGHPRTPQFRLCGDPVLMGRPYCDEHCARAYVRMAA